MDQNFQKITVSEILRRKNGEKITCLTAYTFPIAKILDGVCDVILVGDSLGMTIYGLKDTVDVTFDMMVNHGQAVCRAVKKSLVIVDLPAGTYEFSKFQALRHAKKLMKKTGCDAVKIEVTPDLVKTVKFMVDRGVPVVGHVGLLPQHTREIGGYKYQGKDDNSAAKILETSKEIAKSGAFALVIEAVPAKLADEITQSINIPTIGIGASKNCDGQVLVIDDALGLNQEFKPRFVKHFANLADEVKKAAEKFCEEVKCGSFPEEKNVI